MSKTCRTFLVLALLGVMVAAVFWARRPVGWENVAKMTGVQVPAGAVMSVVEHPTEVEYLGTIDLQSAADVQAFIRLNNLRPMSDHVEADGRVHRGDLADKVSKERYADFYMLSARSHPNAWEFILDTTTRRVHYELLIPDYAGDGP